MIELQEILEKLYTITQTNNIFFNTLVSLTTPGLYRHVLEQDFDPPLYHPNLYEGPMGHLLDIEFDPKNNLKVLTKVISHWWESWSFMRWFYILIGGLGIMIILLLISRCWLAKRPVENFSVLYKAEERPLSRVGVPTPI